MVFSSHLFVFYFLPLSLLLYYAAPRRGKHLLLTLLSYVFYGWANPLFVVLMFVSTVIDYACGLVLVGRWPGWDNDDAPPLPPGGPRSAWQKLALTASICSNLSLLGFFKYFNFGLDSYNALVGSLGWEGGQWDRPLARLAHLFEGGAVWPHPVLAGARLYCKDRHGSLKCFGNSAP